MSRLFDVRLMFWAAILSVALRTPILAAQSRPVGVWSTVSDDDGRPTATVEIRQQRGGEYVGIVRGLLVAASHDHCLHAKCKDERRGQPVLGMTILCHI